MPTTHSAQLKHGIFSKKTQMIWFDFDLKSISILAILIWLEINFWIIDLIWLKITFQMIFEHPANCFACTTTLHILQRKV
jgi:hypothetical protein